MFRFGRCVLIGFAICMLAAQEANAVIRFQPVSQDELKMTSEPLAPGAPAIVLYRQVDRDDDRTTGYEDNYFRIKILTEEGRKYADVEIEFNEGYEDVEDVRARTIKPDGSIVNFDGKVFEKELYKARGVKYHAKTFTLPDVQVGGIIEYSFTVHLTKAWTMFFSNWILSNELFTRKAQFSLKPFNFQWDMQTAAQYAAYPFWHNLPPGTVPPTKGTDNIYRMTANNLPAFPTEDFMPPPNQLKARVDFVYKEVPVETDQVKFWKQFGKKQYSQVEGFIDKRKAMEQAVAQIVSPSDSQDVKLRKIYDRVQQSRNTSYEVQKTEQEQERAKEKPAENVEDLWKRGYGSGYQLTWLFLGLARAAGFEAYGCLVPNRSEYFFSPSTMESGKLNSNVVLVKLNGKDLYFDPGGAFTPFGLLAWPETAVPGLRLDNNAGTWIQTPIPQASESRIERVAKLKLSDTGDLEGQLTVTYTGLEAMERRLDKRHADEVERKEFLEDWVKSQIAMAAEADLANKPDWASSETPLVAEFNLKIPGWATNVGKRAVVPAAIFTAAEKGLFAHADRVYPIYFEYPHEKADDVAIELPAGWQVSSMPPEQNEDGQVILYNLKVEKNSGTLRLTRKLSIQILLMDQKYYTALRNFYQVVQTDDGSQVVLQPGEIHASN